VGETVISTVVSPEDVATAKAAAEKKLDAWKAGLIPQTPRPSKKPKMPLKTLSDEKKSRDAVVAANLSDTLEAAGYPAKANPTMKVNEASWSF